MPICQDVHKLSSSKKTFGASSFLDGDTTWSSPYQAPLLAQHYQAEIFVQTDSRLSKLPDFVHVTGVWIQNLDLRGRPSEACSLLNAKKHASSAPAPPTRNVLGLFYRKRTLDSRAFPYKGSFLYKKMKSCKLANTRTVPKQLPRQ